MFERKVKRRVERKIKRRNVIKGLLAATVVNAIPSRISAVEDPNRGTNNPTQLPDESTELAQSFLSGFQFTNVPTVRLDGQDYPIGIDSSTSQPATYPIDANAIDEQHITIMAENMFSVQGVTGNRYYYIQEQLASGVIGRYENFADNVQIYYLDGYEGMLVPWSPNDPYWREIRNLLREHIVIGTSYRGDRTFNPKIEAVPIFNIRDGSVVANADGNLLQLKGFLLVVTMGNNVSSFVFGREVDAVGLPVELYNRD